MLWVDRVCDAVLKRFDGVSRPLLIRDEKTMSGRVHIGSMRGVAIHGLVSEVLSERGIENEYRYEFNDIDPFDTVPASLDQERFRPHLGKPLYTVPSPAAGSENYAEHFAKEFTAVHVHAHMHPQYYRATTLYGSGKMDPFIRIALSRAADVRQILKTISGSVKDDTWLPVSVICPSCGKIMTTRAYDFDGETVGYACDRSPDDTVPCHATGRVSPFGGKAKFFWKVDWASKWAVLGVDIEGGGKDHSTKGGARDVANHISRELFEYEPPLDIPYEFFLTGGKKMSSSKGRGSTAHDMSLLFPSSVFRLSLIGKDINQQIDIDPCGDSIPRVYDWYDELAEKERSSAEDDMARLYTLASQGTDTPWQLRFSLVAFLVQMPHLSLPEEAARVKGSELTSIELALLEERARYARFWIQEYAGEAFRYTLQETVPESFVLRDDVQTAFSKLLPFMKEGQHTGEVIQAFLFELKTGVPIEPKVLFSALYQLFLNRESGPKAGWFLSVLPTEYVVKQLEKALLYHKKSGPFPDRSR